MNTFIFPTLPGISSPPPTPSSSSSSSTPTSAHASPDAAAVTANGKNDNGSSPPPRTPTPTPQSKNVPEADLPCTPGYLTREGITVELVSQELWRKFHKLGTEMIITKAGR